MSNYSRMFLHFLHAITNDRDRVHTFLFGTPAHQCHPPPAAQGRRRRSGQGPRRGRGLVRGTRIGRTLREFNLVWSRRVLGQGALVLLVSDASTATPAPASLARSSGSTNPAAA